MPILYENNVPKIHADPVIHGHRLEGTLALDAVREWRESGATMCVLAGNVGTGKSLAAAWATYDWAVENTGRNPWGNPVYPQGRLWVAAPHLARMSSWGDDVRECEGAPWLVVDDLGEEEGTPKSLSMISTLLTTRAAEGRPTLITTNLDGGTFRGRYGPRLIDRLRQCGLDERGKARWWVRCGGESLRGRVTPTPVQFDATDIPEHHDNEPEISAERADELAARIFELKQAKGPTQ